MGLGSLCVLSFGLQRCFSLGSLLFSFSRDVHKALLLLNGISLPDRAINISLALSYLACGPTQRGREGGREVGGEHDEESLEDVVKGRKQFRGSFRRSDGCLAFL